MVNDTWWLKNGAAEVWCEELFCFYSQRGDPPVAAHDPVPASVAGVAGRRPCRRVVAPLAHQRP
jgi:hypothetical protein